jgi:CRP/FNR family transcriptional regulator
MVLNLELYDIIKTKSGLVKKDFKKTDVLYEEGSIPRGIYCIESGNIKILKKEVNDKQRIVYLASKNEILGLHAVLNNHTYTNSAVVLDKTKVLFLDTKKFLNLIESNNSYKLLVMKTLCNRIETMETHISRISEKHSEQRFADTLLMLINKYGLKQKKTLRINLSMEELANFTCTSRSYMRKILIDFSQKKIISYHNGEIGILDRKKLESAALNEQELSEA